MRGFGPVAMMVCVAASSLLSAATAQAAPLQWTTCPAGSGLAATPRAECATLTVPMNYSDPAGRHIQIMVSRIPARDPARRLGAVFINPGGPGGESLNIWARKEPMVPAELRDRFDEIAVEPRGLRWSTPLNCTAPGFKPDHIPQGLPDLPDKLACEARDPGYIDAITTEATARDMDAVRQALGEQRIDFIGISAGTNLGAVYATLFPTHIDKLVLDSGIDPDWVWEEQFAQETWAWQARIDDLFDWIAGHDDIYHLGSTRAQVYQVWATQVGAQGGGFLANLGPQTSGLDEQSWRAANLRRSAEHPGVAEGPTFTATFAALYTRQYWPYLAQGMLATRDNPRDTRLLRALARHAPVDSTPGAWVFEASTCNETRAPDPTAIDAAVNDLTTGGSSLDLISNLRRGGLSCLGWQPVTTAVYPTGARLATRPLLLQSDHDPATAAAGAYRLADVMDARVIRISGGDHGHFASGDPKLDATIVRYLETGTVDQTSATQVPIRTPLLPGPLR